MLLKFNKRDFRNELSVSPIGLLICFAQLSRNLYRISKVKLSKNDGGVNPND